MERPRLDVSLIVDPQWSTPGEGVFVGGLWFLRGLLDASDMDFNDTTARYMSLGSPLASSGVAAPAGATYRATKPHTIHTLAVLFTAAFPGGASATLQFNVNGASDAGLILTGSAGDSKKVATGSVVIAQDALVCLECTAFAGAPGDIRSIGIAYRTRAGDNPDV